MATANKALNRPRGPALIPPQTPPGTNTQPPTQATFCAPLFIEEVDGYGLAETQKHYLMFNVKFDNTFTCTAWESMLT